MKTLLAALWLAGGVLAAPAPARAAESAPTMLDIVDRVRAQVATQLGRRKADVEITRSLFAQGLDELDMVELVMALEETFKVTIPDAELATPGDKDWFRKLTAQRLAEVIAAQLRVTK